VSPQPGYLAIGWTVAARVARYLLPDLRSDDHGQPRCSGIPGLRLAGIATGSIQLTHLPTGGALELHEASRFRPAIMADALRLETCHSPEDQHDFEAGELLWQRPELDDAETADMACWDAFAARARPVNGHGPHSRSVAALARPARQDRNTGGPARHGVSYTGRAHPGCRV
jgi:hypothetical protein